MIILNLTLNLIFFYSLLARVSRWVSIFQQKEYRPDRMLAFLKSSEGRRELTQIINLPLSKAEFRRPKPTLRSISLALTTILLILFTPVETIYDLAAMYLFVPLYLFIANLPFILAVKLVTIYFQKRAQKLVSQHQPIIIGITGSYAKTTTKLILQQILSSTESAWATPKSFNNPLSLPRSILSGYRGQKYLIIEYAAYTKGENASLARLFPPQFIVFTGINAQHLALFGSWENMVSAETELLHIAPPQTPVVYNQSDSTVNQLVKKFTDLKLIGSHTTKLTHTKIDSSGHLSFAYKKTKINTQLIGPHYLDNLKLAITTANYFGISRQKIKSSLKSFSPPEQFIQISQGGKDCLIINDGNTSNPSGFEAALTLLSQIPATQKIIITAGIIDLGTKESSIHTHLANLIKHHSIHLLHTSAVGQKEFQSILGNNYTRINHPNQLQQFTTTLNPKSAVLIEGKLRSDYLQIINASS